MGEVLPQESEGPSSPLESLSSVVGALGAGAILPCSNLRVECPNVKQYTALLEGQSPLLCRDPRERVVPVEEQPGAPGGTEETCVQETELAIVGCEQIQARLVPAGSPRGLP